MKIGFKSASGTSKELHHMLSNNKNGKDSGGNPTDDNHDTCLISESPYRILRVSLNFCVKFFDSNKISRYIILSKTIWETFGRKSIFKTMVKALLITQVGKIDLFENSNSCLIEIWYLLLLLPKVF